MEEPLPKESCCEPPQESLGTPLDQVLQEKELIESKTQKGTKPLRKLKPKKSKVSQDAGYDSTRVEHSPLEVSERFKRGCECQDDQCFKGLNPEIVYRHRLNIAELTKAEHDMYLMGVTMACLTNPYETARHTERRRLRAQYVYQGRRVCLDAFLYLENCTHYQIKRIRKHLVTHGVTPRVHGNHGKVPHNTFSLDIYKSATEFLKHFVKVQEARLKTRVARNTPLHLPAYVTRKTVHELYAKYCRRASPSVKIMGYSTFARFVKVQFPQVKFARQEFGWSKEAQRKEVMEKKMTTEEEVEDFEESEIALMPLVITGDYTAESGTY